MLESFLNKVAGLRTFNFIKKKFQRRYFPMGFSKILRTPTLKNICEQLPLYLHVIRTLLNIYDEILILKTVNDLLFPQKGSIIDT